MSCIPCPYTAVYHLTLDTMFAPTQNNLKNELIAYPTSEYAISSSGWDHSPEPSPFFIMFFLLFVVPLFVSSRVF